MLCGSRESGDDLPPDDYQQYVDFFENAVIPMHWVGQDGTVFNVSTDELDALGYAREEYVGDHIADFHADQHVIDDILERLSSGEELRDYETRMVRKDGSIRHVLISSSVNREDGEFVNTRCVTRDITDKEYNGNSNSRTTDWKKSTDGYRMRSSRLTRIGSSRISTTRPTM